MTFGEKVKDIRKNELHLNQTDFAKLLGISRTYVTEIENGRIKGNTKLLKKLSEITGKSIEYFISNSEDEINVKPFEVLNNIIDNFIENGLIDKDCKMTDEVEEFLHSTMLKEIKNKLSLLNESKEI